MIDRDLIESLDSGMKQVVVNAIRSIAQSGIIESQRDRNFARVLAGAADEDPHKLAERIIEHRKAQYGLDSLLQLADSVKDIRNA